MQNLQPEAKIILLGEFGVGKSSIFRRFSQGTFVDTSDMDWAQYRESTLGLDNFCKKYECITNANETKTISLRLFDTGGLERIGSISNSYYKFSEAVLLVFARNNIDSFNCITQHLLEVLSLAENARIYLVSNKIDLTNECEVTDDDIQSFMEQFPNIEAHFKVSCKTNEPSVDDMFKSIAMRIANSNTNKLAHRLDSFRLTQMPMDGSMFASGSSSSTGDPAGPPYEYHYERNGDMFKQGSSCSSCGTI